MATGAWILCLASSAAVFKTGPAIDVEVSTEVVLHIVLVFTLYTMTQAHSQCCLELAMKLRHLGTLDTCATHACDEQPLLAIDSEHAQPRLTMFTCFVCSSSLVMSDAYIVCQVHREHPDPTSDQHLDSA